MSTFLQRSWPKTTFFFVFFFYTILYLVVQVKKMMMMSRIRSSYYAMPLFFCKSSIRNCLLGSTVTRALATFASMSQISESRIATVSLHRSPVNSFNIPFSMEVTNILSEVEQSGEFDAIIIKSSLPKVFSAGLDLNELYNTPRQHMETFWHAFQNLWYQIYSSKLVTLALVSGHCLAAGTVIAAACDYRLGIEGNYAIGVPAARIGLVAPPWFLETLCNLMGVRKTEQALQIGKTFSPQEALHAGLLDQVCSAQEGSRTSLEVLAQYLSVCQESRGTMKQYLRAELLHKFERSRDQDMHDFVDHVTKVSVQEKLYSYIQEMRKR